MSLFFSKGGRHVVCGGTTASIVANYLGKEVIAETNNEDTDIPPMSRIDGVDLVTEGIVTMNEVLKIARDYLKGEDDYDAWAFGRDGAAQICQLLFEEATDINFFVGRARNPAHQGADTPINFNIKMNIVEELSACLRQMGKQVKVSYF